MLEPFRILARIAALGVAILLLAAISAARWTILPEHRAMLGVVGFLLLAGFVLSERRS